MKHEFINYYSPEQNGLCKRFNQITLDGIRTILAENGLLNQFWQDAILYFA